MTKLHINKKRPQRMHRTERRERLQAISSGATCIYPASVFDPISFRVAEELSIEAGIFARAGVTGLTQITLVEFTAPPICLCG